jgi:hypothetical protein
MKRTIAIIIVTGLLTSVLLAMNLLIDRKAVPAISLPDAYSEAVQALGAIAPRFHCTDGFLQHSKTYEGEWQFDFYTTNGETKCVFVPLDKKIKPLVFDTPPPT